MGNVSIMKDELMDTSSTSAPLQPAGVTYTIGGVKVEFPAKAYPSQVSMMDKIIRGCHRAQNCLLESPTGSGKTLALLCGALAWQKAESERVHEINAKNLMEYRQKEMEWRQKHDEILKKMSANQKPVTADSCLNEPLIPPVDVKNIENIIIVDNPDEEEDDIFRKCSLPKKMKMDGDCSSFPLAESSVKTVIADHGTNKKETFAMNEAVNSEKIPGMPAPPKEIKVPKIYFGTRTHKQIAQVVHELRRTAYNNVNITILSSRTHSCIMDDKYGNHQNKTELCNELLDPRRGPGCRYKLNVKNYRHHNLIPASELPTIWDLEDLIMFGRKRMACPYFVARELKPFSSIIFCPYNYLIDPLIRKSMDINLKGDILILDEAHNIEDTCRESASFTIQQRQVQDAMKECEEIANQTQFSEPYRDLAQIFQSLSLWIDQYKNSVNDISDYDKGQLTFFGPEAIKLFDDYEFGKNNFGKLELALKQIDMIKAENDEEDTIAAVTKNLAEGLRLILGLLYDDRYACDYHVVLTKNFAHQSQEEPSADDSGWFNRRKKAKTVQGWHYSLNFWCFNPATIFCEIKEDCRSIILTSGTLAPMDSFQSELGALFPITLEANHVIDPSQCWVGSLGFGPSNVLLDGTYKSTSTYQFQDEIGRILLKLCSVVPHGVLCFVPSYTLLEKLRDRWNFTKLIEEIEQHKEVVWEPRRGNELDELLSRFYRTIEETSNNVVGESVTGVLFLAVCRGKVSEGLDFADKNARTVVTIGIPFPNVKDSQVVLKKSYNDKHQHTKGLLNGRDWYQIQAFRALNQALGRCIRHRRDWGAILLLDSRFSNEYYCKGLSKWVRNKVRHHSGFQSMVNELSTFIQTRLQIEQNENISCP